jgi:hypothetical protein
MFRDASHEHSVKSANHPELGFAKKANAKGFGNGEIAHPE